MAKPIALGLTTRAKNGQAGITSASVTIEIDNSDNKFGRDEYDSTIVVRREVCILQSLVLLSNFIHLFLRLI